MIESDTLDPIKPGDILLEEFLEPLQIGQNQFARDIAVPVSRIAEIIKGSRSITPDTALRFATAFGTSAEFWLNLQMDHDLRQLRSGSWQDIEAGIKSYIAT